MKDKMNLSRGRDRDRTARQVNQIIILIYLNDKLLFFNFRF